MFLVLNVMSVDRSVVSFNASLLLLLLFICSFSKLDGFFTEFHGSSKERGWCFTNEYRSNTNDSRGGKLSD